MGELLEKWPPRVLAPGEVIGTLTAKAAEALGLRQTVKVVQGGADALIGMIGLEGRPTRSARPHHRSPRTCSSA